jgi:hypothetical protein
VGLKSKSIQKSKVQENKKPKNLRSEKEILVADQIGVDCISDRDLKLKS